MEKNKDIKINMDNIKIKKCPYCNKDLKLVYFIDPDDDNEQGYTCSYCGMFLDIELQGDD